MEEKKSIGVVVFGWVFIFLGIFLFLYHLLSWLSVETSAMFGFSLLVLSLGKRVPLVFSRLFFSIYFFWLAYSGFELLNFRNFARKSVILLFLLAIVYVFYIFNPLKLSFHGRLGEIPRSIALSEKIYNVFFASVVNIIISIPFLSVIYFFTRRKIIGQFK